MGLVHYVHFILLFLVYVAKCNHEYECSDWLPQFDKPDEPDCYMPKEGNDKLLTLAPSSPYPVSWVVNNSDLGEIDVEFAIMSNYTDYIINLAVSNVSERTCAGPHLFKKHSTRNYIIAHFNDSENDNFLCERVDVEDDRCDVNSVWITPPNYCRRTLVLNLNESLPSYDLTEIFSDDSHNIILSVMLSILVLALVLVAICYFKTMAYPHQVSRQRRDDSLRKPSFIPLVGGGKDNPAVMVVDCCSYCNACEIQTND
uniref:Uncharacterized protein n=1 Tax=Timema bartmani TaxID=61472 RepID=A0A7R9EMZ9_9NEOP|nr:unnamed protein product [Timema bartmani]